MATKRTKQIAPIATEPKRIGRPPMPYDPAVAAQICDAVATGRNLNQIADDEAFPSRQVIYKWLRESEAFRNDYARAREDRADIRNDRIDDITSKVLAGELDPNAARVVIDAIKWQAGKEAPKYYGDYNRTELEVKGDVADALSQARQRLAVVKPKPADSSAA